MGSGGSNSSGGGGGGGTSTEQQTTLPPEPIQSQLEQYPEGSYWREVNVEPDDAPINEGGVLTGPGVKAEDLPSKYKEAIFAYSGGKVVAGERFAGFDAEKLNMYIYNKQRFIDLYTNKSNRADLLKRAEAFKNELNTSLGKVRNYEGEVYRTINADPAVIGARYTEGKIATVPEFISSSRSIKGSMTQYDSVYGPSEVRFQIKSKTGKLIERVSNYRAELEVLFKSDTKFMVISKKMNKSRNTLDIIMEEI